MEQELIPPPHSIEAEQAVLGGVMLDNMAFHRVMDVINEDDFYRRDHRIIFRAMQELIDRSEPCDAVTLSEHLKSRGELDDIGGLSYLGGLAQDTPTTKNIIAYANIVWERAMLRSCVQIGGEIQQMAYDHHGRGVTEVISEVQGKAFALGEKGRRKGRGPVRLGAGIGEWLDDLDERSRRGSDLAGRSTGFHDVDRLTLGMEPGDLWVIAGRPSMGKTGFAISLLHNMVLSRGEAGLLFSMEMSRRQITDRTVSMLADIPLHNIRSGRLEQGEWSRVSEATGLLAQSKLVIDDSPEMSANEIRARAMRVHRRLPLSLIVVDYLQLATAEGEQNREREVAIISKRMKGIAKDLGVPVVILSQLNRGLEQRSNKRPVMSDIRESGAVEQDADVIGGLYRHEVYVKDAPPGVAEFIVMKQRNGPVGTVPMTFLSDRARFCDADRDTKQQYRSYLGQ